jgi:anthranilate phosphoribosyltransferase
VSECHAGAVRTFYIHPADFGVTKAAPEELKGGDAGQNAQIVRDILDGKHGAPRRIVVLNAAAALFVAGKAASIADGIRMAVAAIDSGAARETLTRMAAGSQAPLDPAEGKEVVA